MEKDGNDAIGKAHNVEDAMAPGGGVLLYQEDGRALNLPVPSSDPNDPLNFGVWRQRLVLAAVCIYGITGFGVIQATPLVFGNLIGEYKMQTRGVSRQSPSQEPSWTLANMMENSDVRPDSHRRPFELSIPLYGLGELLFCSPVYGSGPTPCLYSQQYHSGSIYHLGRKVTVF